jgi:hypothetical protein
MGLFKKYLQVIQESESVEETLIEYIKSANDLYFATKEGGYGDQSIFISDSKSRFEDEDYEVIKIKKNQIKKIKELITDKNKIISTKKIKDFTYTIDYSGINVEINGFEDLYLHQLVIMMKYPINFEDFINGTDLLYIDRKKIYKKDSKYYYITGYQDDGKITMSVFIIDINKKDFLFNKEIKLKDFKFTALSANKGKKKEAHENDIKNFKDELKKELNNNSIFNEIEDFLVINQGNNNNLNRNFLQGTSNIEYDKEIEDMKKIKQYLENKN